MNAGLSKTGVITLISQLSANSRWAPGIGIPMNAPTYGANVSTALRSVGATSAK
jgi:hypothetical protein